MTKISTHTLTWSVTRSSAGRPDRTEYFNSHAHVERDEIVKGSSKNNPISTHTLTWSVTRFVILKFTATTFQLTRSRGA